MALWGTKRLRVYGQKIISYQALGHTVLVVLLQIFFVYFITTKSRKNMNTYEVVDNITRPLNQGNDNGRLS